MLYLAHHGIKGQKWGVRRFQNEDGSYTDMGRKRYLERGATKPGSFEDSFRRQSNDSTTNTSKVLVKIGTKITKDPSVRRANRDASIAYYNAGRNENDPTYVKARERFMTISQKKAMKFSDQLADAYMKDVGANDKYYKLGKKEISKRLRSDLYIGTPGWSSASSPYWKKRYGISSKGPDIDPRLLEYPGIASGNKKSL